MQCSTLTRAPWNLYMKTINNQKALSRRLNKKDRLVTIPEFQNISAKPTTLKGSPQDQIIIAGNTSYYIPPSTASFYQPQTTSSDSTYHFPIIYNFDNSLWDDANMFLFELSINHVSDNSITEGLLRKASTLLDYKIWLEENNRDILDFSATRPVHRVTYAYFLHLRGLKISPGNLNQRTSVIYKFYKFLSKQPGRSFDLKRVEQTTNAVIGITGKSGAYFQKEYEKRTQTVRRNKVRPVDIDRVRDDGEDLRPLEDNELKELLKVIYSDNIKTDHKLMFEIALDTGARKQSVLTLSMKHLKYFDEKLLIKSGLYKGKYKINAGPGQAGEEHTGIDTKNNKRHTLYFSKKLAEKIKLYANCEISLERQKKFRTNYGDCTHQDDMYIFLSERGNCHYMSKSDPRFLKTKSRPNGRITSLLSKKIKTLCDKTSFPSDFTFHWTRATFALSWYKALEPLVKKGIISIGDQISIIQHLLGHENRDTTENYLKLFSKNNINLEAQNQFEDRLFNSENGLQL